LSFEDGTDYSTGVARVAIHEVGHQFDVAVLPDEHRTTNDNIMYDGTLMTVQDSAFYFHPEDIAFLRFSHKAPGSR